jgi:FixJ family two-component response regulator
MKQSLGVKNGSEPRVFVVNDEQSIQKSLAQLLATENYSVEIFVWWNW